MAVAWADGVNKKVRRSGTSWNDQCGFVEDETRSGKTKRRLSHTMEKRKFSVSFLFDYSEYVIFKQWFNDVTKKGFYSFMFPQIDVLGGGADTEYRFVSDGAPKYSNPNGSKIEVSMDWEEV